MGFVFVPGIKPFVKNPYANANGPFAAAERQLETCEGELWSSVRAPDLAREDGECSERSLRACARPPFSFGRS